MTAVVVNIPGPPVPKGRPRFTRGGFAYTPDKTRKYEKLVASLAKTAMAGRPPFGCPVKVMVTAFMRMPQMSKKERQTRWRAISCRRSSRTQTIWPRRRLMPATV